MGTLFSRQLPQLPLEIYNNIILRSGGIPLLKQISKQLIKLNSKLVEEYNMITQPITRQEIKSYLKNKPKSITTFHCDKNKIVSILYKAYGNGTYECYENMNYNGLTIYFFTGFGHQEYFRNYDRSIKKFVDEYECNNYDILTIFNIISNRTSDRYLARKVCIDTLNYYYKVLENEILWVYLYMTAKSFGKLTSIGPSSYNKNKDLIPFIYEEILNNLLMLNNDVRDYYGNYVIKPV